ncbi:MAG: radical SAM protein [Nitrospinaceae bacterium]|nr:radical SAM protein [Nitrospinaceae bacterium]
MNIILNSYCNLKCNYCFADEYMDENVKTPEKSMDYDFFRNEMLPRIKNVTLINFMGGEPTLHPRFNDMLSDTVADMQPFTYLGVFTNGLMPDKVLELLLKMVGPEGSIVRHIQFSVLLNWQTMENTTERNHQRCREVAEAIIGVNGLSLMFSINLYSIQQDLATQCREIDQIYQDMGLPEGQSYKIRVSPAFPIVGEEHNVSLPISDYPRMGRKMLDLMKELPQLTFRFDCSFPPCLLNEIEEEEFPLVERFFYHGNQPVPNLHEWKDRDLYLGCADDSPMDIDPKGDCFNCFPFHNLKLGNVGDYKEVNEIAVKQMHTKFLGTVFGDDVQPKEPCKSCPHYMVRCTSGCFSYNFS